MNFKPMIFFLLGILVIITGCVHESLTPSPGTEFPVPPVALPAQYHANSARGSFENSYLVDYYPCSNGSESFTTNYILFTGSGGLRHMHYALIPVDNTNDLKEVPLSSDILNASISPDDFVALPDYIYQSRVQITVGPNVTGEQHTNPDGSGWSRDPGFPFVLKVMVDGIDAPGADDQIMIMKVCSMHPMPVLSLNPSLYQRPESDIIVKAGDRQEVDLTVKNVDGGIRELYFDIPGRLKGTGWGFPLDPRQLMPIPEGMHFTLNPPVMQGRNFRFSNDTLEIATDSSTPLGNYTFPLVLCYRNLNPNNTTSSYFPFEEKTYCPTAGQLTVDIV